MMDRTEPALVPEWLRCTGNVTGGGSTIHRSDVTSPSNYSRSRSFSSNKDKDSPQYSDKSSSSNSRRSSSGSGPAKHPYSSFSRSHRDKNRDKAKEKSYLEDIWDHDSSDPLASILTSRVERSSLRRSRSLVSRKPAVKLSQKIEDSQVTRNGALSGGNNPHVIQKTVFEKDFPSLRTQEKQGVVGISRVLSPRLTSVVQSLSIGNSGVLTGEKWTSALAEVPAIPANNGFRPPLQQNATTAPNSSSGVSTTGGLNMAEALSQPAARARVTQQLPDKSQRLEELAIKQSRQLIPMTPSMPKPLVSSSVDKTKQQKIVAKTNELPMASRSIHPQSHSVHLANQSRVVPNRSDSGSASHTGKFLVLKPGRETTALGAKDVSSSSGDADGKVANGQLATPSTPTTSTTVMTPMVVSALENKVAVLSLSSKSTADKKSSQFLAQSRSEFFNLMRRKNSSGATQIQSDSSSTISSPTAQTYEGGHDTINTHVVENGNQIICNGNRHDIPEKIEGPDGGDYDISGNGSICPDEEEAAFLRSLGWEEHGGEDEGLTEEEINAFYQEYMNRRPSLEIHQSSQPKVSMPVKFPSAIPEIHSSDSSSSESEREA